MIWCSILGKGGLPWPFSLFMLCTASQCTISLLSCFSGGSTFSTQQSSSLHLLDCPTQTKMFSSAKLLSSRNQKICKTSNLSMNLMISNMKTGLFSDQSLNLIYGKILWQRQELPSYQLSLNYSRSPSIGRSCSSTSYG